MPPALRSVASSDAGPVRPRNCDSFHVGPSVLAVADGVDDAPFGDVASALAVDHVRRLEEAPGTLAAAAHAANTALRTRGAQTPALLGMGTTLLAVRLEGSALSWVSFGDSALHLLRDGVLSTLTPAEDVIRSLVAEGRVEADGLVAPALLDGGSLFVVAQQALEVGAGDRLLLGTRGLAELAAEDLHAALSVPEPGPESAVMALVEAARAASAAENLTVVVADVVEAP
ncbi:PP2C family protein-serine/threonine phosphatase [Actinocorallia longicatena]|uniref:PPM-type phosphatase domain-containing protein n=1 Tax=Actinocorallia longicatena TaxID=111803 RepID=A0ABP6QEB3_9ACTN